MHRYNRTTTLVRLALALGLLGASGFAHALGLGKFVLHSGLDEPLNAVIEITAANQNELKSLKAGLASRDEFDNAGVDRPEHLTLIKYTLTQGAEGAPVLKLTTDQPIREPFLHFLVQAQWAGGHIVREYTALLDPPQLASGKVPAVESPSVASSPSLEVIPEPTAEAAAPAEAQGTEAAAQAATGPEGAPAERSQEKAQAPAGQTPGAPEDSVAPPSPVNVADIPVAPEAEAGEALLGPNDSVASTAPVAAAKPLPEPTVTNGSDWATRSEYQVKRGDTLSKIVRDINIDNSLSAEQIMLAMLKTNKAAFFGSNVNNLKSGRILKIPARDEITATSKPKALKEFRAQYNSWQEYKLKLAGSSQVVKVAEADKGTARGDIAAQPTGASKGAGGKDLLKIVRADNDKLSQKGAGGATGTPASINERQALMDKAATLEETLASKELENKELRERVSQLEAQIKNAKRLVEIENKELAKTQKQAGETKQAAGTKQTDAKQTADATQAQAGPTSSASSQAAGPAAAKNPEKAASAATADAKPGQPAAKKRAAPVPAPVQQEEESLLDSVLNTASDIFSSLSDVLTLSIAGGALAIGGGAFLIYYRRRRRAMAEFGESILSGGLNLNSEGGAAAGPEGEKSADVSFLSDFSQGGMGNIHTDEVDPIAEAEVYLAYGRDEQAEEILKEAVVKDPARHELRLKLLEIYQQRKDLRAFETVAEELYAALEGKGGRVWEKAEEMGHNMNPHNPLFRGALNRSAGGGRAYDEAHSSFDGGLMMQGAMPPAEPIAESIDLDLGNFNSMSASHPAASAESNDGFGLDLDFTATNDSSSARAINREPEGTSSHSGGGIDFDFSALTAATESATTTESAAEPAASGDFHIGFEDAAKTSSAGGELDFGELSLEGAAVVEVSSDEISTKLDLAKAYIDMGDADGARSILDEVLAEGSDAQKKQAADLAAQIAA